MASLGTDRGRRVPHSTLTWLSSEEEEDDPATSSAALPGLHFEVLRVDRRSTAERYSTFVLEKPSAFIQSRSAKNGNLRWSPQSALRQMQVVNTNLLREAMEDDKKLEALYNRVSLVEPPPIVRHVNSLVFTQEDQRSKTSMSTDDRKSPAKRSPPCERQRTVPTNFDRDLPPAATQIKLGADDSSPYTSTSRTPTTEELTSPETQTLRPDSSLEVHLSGQYDSGLSRDDQSYDPPTRRARLEAGGLAYQAPSFLDDAFVPAPSNNANAASNPHDPPRSHIQSTFVQPSSRVKSWNYGTSWSQQEEQQDVQEESCIASPPDGSGTGDGQFSSSSNLNSKTYQNRRVPNSAAADSSLEYNHTTYDERVPLSYDDCQRHLPLGLQTTAELCQPSVVVTSNWQGTAHRAGVKLSPPPVMLDGEVLSTSLMDSSIGNQGMHEGRILETMVDIDEYHRAEVERGTMERQPIQIGLEGGLRYPMDHLQDQRRKRGSSQDYYAGCANVNYLSPIRSSHENEGEERGRASLAQGCAHCGRHSVDVESSHCVWPPRKNYEYEEESDARVKKARLRGRRRTRTCPFCQKRNGRKPQSTDVSRSSPDSRASSHRSYSEDEIRDYYYKKKNNCARCQKSRGRYNIHVNNFLAGTSQTDLMGESRRRWPSTRKTPSHYRCAENEGIGRCKKIPTQQIETRHALTSYQVTQIVEILPVSMHSIALSTIEPASTVRAQCLCCQTPPIMASADHTHLLETINHRVGHTLPISTCCPLSLHAPWHSQCHSANCLQHQDSVSTKMLDELKLAQSKAPPCNCFPSPSGQKIMPPMSRKRTGSAPGSPRPTRIVLSTSSTTASAPPVTGKLDRKSENQVDAFTPTPPADSHGSGNCEAAAASPLPPVSKTTRSEQPGQDDRITVQVAVTNYAGLGEKSGKSDHEATTSEDLHITESRKDHSARVTTFEPTTSTPTVAPLSSTRLSTPTIVRVAPQSEPRLPGGTSSVFSPSGSVRMSPLVPQARVSALSPPQKVSYYHYRPIKLGEEGDTADVQHSFISSTPTPSPVIQMPSSHRGDSSQPSQFASLVQSSVERAQFLESPRVSTSQIQRTIVRYSR